MTILLPEHRTTYAILSRDAATPTQLRIAAFAACQLPNDPSPNRTDPHPERLTSNLPEQLIARLAGLADSSATGLHTVLLAAFAVFLVRHADEPQLRLAVTADPVSEWRGTTARLEVDLADDRSFRDLLTAASAVVRRISEATHGPYAAAPAAGNWSTGFCYTRLTDDAATCRPELDDDIPAGDLRLELVHTGTWLEASWVYNPGRFSPATVERLQRTFLNLLSAIIAGPDRPIGLLSLLNTAEYRQLLVEWNQTDAAYPDTQCIHTLFEAQAARTPDAVALVFGSQQMSYRELNRRANQVARRLQALGVGPDVIVGLYLERSLEQIVALLGILKAGAAYLPLDPALPRERLALMIEDSRAPLAVTRTNLVERMVDIGVPTVEVDLATPTTPADDENLSAGGPDSLAYVIYTSGSTGMPKGVLIEHRGLVNHTSSMITSHDLSADDRVLQFSSLGFDAAAATLYPALLVGATLILPELALAELIGDALTRLCEEQRISVLQLPASVWHQWVDELHTRGEPLRAPLRVMLVGGESPALDKLRIWADLVAHPTRFLNAYGPTEAAITTTLFATACDADTLARLDCIPIGRPLENKEVYLLDARLQPVPVGVAGELYIGGIGLARGYLNRPELTAERFIEWSPDPALGPPIGRRRRLYRTGDLARYRPDGMIEFLGRADHQVKLRGYRIELGEIEARLRQHPAVRDAVVLIREDVSGLPQLVAYVVAHTGATLITEGAPSQTDRQRSAELRAYLQARLPEYMIPSAVVWLPALPLNHNGKLDRRALPAPGLTAPDGACTAPRTTEETLIAQIWAEVLGYPRIGVDDDFFALGGHSLSAARAIARINAALGASLPLGMIYTAPTVTAFARAARDNCRTPETPTHDELLADVTLDPAIDITPGARRVSTGKPAAIFLTGATGFIGAYLLEELLAQTDARVFCLVRANDAASGLRRLNEVAARYHMRLERHIDRIIPVPGDLRLPRFGLEIERFRQLADQVDVIYHSGAQVHYLYPYSALKAANVQGTAEVLRLAARGRIKPVHYISTLAVAVRSRTEPGLLEDEPLEPCRCSRGYDQSKWVAEAISRLAQDRGLPVSIYRPSRIGSHSRTGAINADDFFIRLLTGCIQLGSAPDIDFAENLIPVDHAVRTIVQLAQHPAPRHGTYHVFNPQHVHWRWVVDQVTMQGYPLRLLPYAEWHRGMVDVVARDPSHVLHSLMAYLPADERDAAWIDDLAHQQFDMRNTMAGLGGNTPYIPAFDTSMLHRMLAYALTRGMLGSTTAYRSAAR